MALSGMRPAFGHVGLRLAAVALIAAGMASASTSARPETITREEVLAALPALEKLARDTIASGSVPGLSIAVVYRDEVVYLGGFGLREAGRPDPVDADTVFQLASFSKPISSTVVAALVSDGTVSWDQRIADLDPGFALHDAYPTQQVKVGFVLCIVRVLLVL
jgi:CubicO group peptidase (beta-lactamase class C family)